MKMKTKIKKIKHWITKGLQLEIEKNYVINYVNSHLILFLNKSIPTNCQNLLNNIIIRF